MRIAITAASGLVGGALARALEARGDGALRLVRRTAGPGEAAWDPVKGQLEREKLARAEAVVHLSGEPIAAGRWTPARKRLILESRVQSTDFLCREIAQCAPQPKMLVCASAIGFYGDRGAEILDEESAPGTGFLAEVCRAWEAACAPARAAGIRVVNLRIGMVLSAAGGALPNMLTPFRLGLGGPLAGGSAYMSWITLDDLVRAILHCIDGASLSGPVNGVAPGAVTNGDFTRALGRAVHRPALVPAPGFAIRALLGEMGQELLLSSTRVAPRRLLESGFQFQHTEIGDALGAVLSAKQ